MTCLCDVQATKAAYWDPSVIPEDWHMYFRCVFADQGRYGSDQSDPYCCGLRDGRHATLDARATWDVRYSSCELGFCCSMRASRIVNSMPATRCLQLDVCNTRCLHPMLHTRGVKLDARTAMPSSRCCGLDARHAPCPQLDAPCAMLATHVERARAASSARA